MITENISRGDLAYWNPWWKTGAFPSDDENISDWAHSSFKWEPRLSKTIEDEDVIYVLRGPRRVGKTTLLKLRIKRLLEQGVSPENLFYFPCDAVETSRQLMKVIDTYFSHLRKPDERAYLFIDEVSMLKEWQRSVKLLFDAGKFRSSTVILTGSHSIDLRKGSETLSGRRGKIDKLRYGTPDKILLPAKFSEYVETLNATISNEIRKLWLLSLENRKAVLLKLAQGRVLPHLNRLALFTKELENLLDQYMLTGGIAQAVHQYVSRRRIAEDTYNTFVNFIIRDIVRWNYDEIYARQILRRIFEVLSSCISWNQLKNGTEVRDVKTVESYVNVLKDSFAIAYYYQLDVSKSSPDYMSNKKIYFQDPFILHACRGWIYGKKAFDLSQSFLSSSENKSKLLECIIANHLSRFMFNLNPSSLFDPSNYVFYWRGKKREVDFVIELGGKFLPIEVKYSDNIGKDDAGGIYDFMKTGCSHDFGIITSRQQLEVRKRYIVIPSSILLLLA